VTKVFKKPATWALALNNPSATTYVFVETLRVNTRENEVVLILDEIDIESSRQLINEAWEPVQRGNFHSFFRKRTGFPWRDILAALLFSSVVKLFIRTQYFLIRCIHSASH
jgi:hypothetical protein